MNDKQKYNQMIGKRLAKVFDELHLSQQQVLARCLEKGYNISQPALSKLKSGSSVSVLQVVQICEVLGVDISDILSMDEEKEVQIPGAESSEYFMRDAKHKYLVGYTGSYSAYFYTTQNEDRIHQGTFILDGDKKGKNLAVDFRFKTGETDENGKEIEKHYTGPAYYSMPMQAVYCEITSEDIGEKCYLLFHYDFLTHRQLECRLAIVITVSSGTRRFPTAHKLLLTRDSLMKDELDYLCGQLKLNSSKILISEKAYKEFLQDPLLPEEFLNIFGGKESYAEKFLGTVEKMEYFSFNESLISDSNLQPMDKMKIICLLRKYSAAARYSKVSEKAEELVYKFLKYKKEKTKEESPSDE